MVSTLSEPMHTIGSYRIIELLATGGAGVIYRAEDPRTGALVALKSVALPRQGMLQSIRREIHALARIKHPGIIHIVGHGVDNGLPWYAMEMLEGITLRSWMRGSKQGRTVTEVLTVVHRICSPLAYLHGEGIVHRDLKPENVLIRANGMPVILDFGLQVQYGGELSRETLAVDSGISGTLQYMAPEHILGELVDARADLYSLGCVLYELLTGRPPFTATEPLKLFSAHLHDLPKPPSQLVEDLAPELDQLVLRLLTKDRRERPGYADDVATVLARLGADSDHDPAAPRPRTYLYRPGLTGRQDQLTTLRSALEQLQEGTSAVVLLRGESGVGKTRLAMELAREAGSSKITVITGQCQAAGGQPFDAFRRALQTVADRCQELGPGETDHLLGSRAKVLAAYEPALLDLPGLDSYPEPVTLRPDAARHRLFSYFTQTLGALTRKQPLLLIIDDLQWADDLAIGLIELIARGAADEQLAILLVGTYRSEEMSGALHILGMLEGTSTIDLTHLDEAAVGVMASDMLGLATPPPSLSRYLYRHSEGNPFFVAEYLRAAVEEGLLRRDGAGSWQVADSDQAAASEMPDFEGLPVPGSVRELVSRRLQGLSPLAGKTVAAAAVAGREVSALLVRSMLGISESELMDVLDELSQRQLLEEQVQGRLRFLHTQIQEVAYAAQSADQRQRQHGLAAAAMTTVWTSDELEQHAAELATHYDQSGAVAEAAQWYQRAGERAADQFAAAESLRYLSRALELIPTADRGHRFTILLLRENVYATLGERAAQQQDLSALETLAEEMDRRQQAEVALRQAGYAQNTSQHTVAISLSERAIELARAVSDTAIEAAGHLQRAQGSWRLGELDAAAGQLKTSLSLAGAAGERQVEADALRILGNVCYYQGSYPQAIECWQQSLPISCRLGDRVGEASTLSNLGEAERILGDYDSAAEHYQQRLQICREIGDREGESIALVNLALVTHNLGDHAGAEDYCRQTLKIAQDIGNRTHQGYALTNLGHALAGLATSPDCDRSQATRLLDEATDTYGLALALRRQLDEHFLVMESLAGLALVALQREDLTQALSQVEEILSFLESNSVDGTEEPLRIYHSCYQVLKTVGDPRAPSILADACQLIRERAAKIPEPMRSSYLENVAVHRALLQASELPD